MATATKMLSPSHEPYLVLGLTQKEAGVLRALVSKVAHRPSNNPSQETLAISDALRTADVHMDWEAFNGISDSQDHPVSYLSFKDRK